MLLERWYMLLVAAIIDDSLLKTLQPDIVAHRVIILYHHDHDALWMDC